MASKSVIGIHCPIDFDNIPIDLIQAVLLRKDTQSTWEDLRNAFEYNRCICELISSRLGKPLQSKRGYSRIVRELTKAKYFNANYWRYWRLDDYDGLWLYTFPFKRTGYTWIEGAYTRPLVSSKSSLFEEVWSPVEVSLVPKEMLLAMFLVLGFK